VAEVTNEFIDGLVEKIMRRETEGRTPYGFARDEVAKLGDGATLTEKQERILERYLTHEGGNRVSIADGVNSSSITIHQNSWGSAPENYIPWTINIANGKIESISGLWGIVDLNLLPENHPVYLYLLRHEPKLLETLKSNEPTTKSITDDELNDIINKLMKDENFNIHHLRVELENVKLTEEQSARLEPYLSYADDLVEVQGEKPEDTIFTLRLWFYKGTDLSLNGSVLISFDRDKNFLDVVNETGTHSFDALADLLREGSPTSYVLEKQHPELFDSMHAKLAQGPIEEPQPNASGFTGNLEVGNVDAMPQPYGTAVIKPWQYYIKFDKVMIDRPLFDYYGDDELLGTDLPDLAPADVETPPLTAEELATQALLNTVRETKQRIHDYRELMDRRNQSSIVTIDDTDIVWYLGLIDVSALSEIDGENYAGLGAYDDDFFTACSDAIKNKKLIVTYSEQLNNAIVVLDYLDRQDAKNKIEQYLRDHDLTTDDDEIFDLGDFGDFGTGGTDVDDSADDDIDAPDPLDPADPDDVLDPPDDPPPVDVLDQPITEEQKNSELQVLHVSALLDEYLVVLGRWLELPDSGLSDEARANVTSDIAGIKRIGEKKAFLAEKLKRNGTANGFESMREYVEESADLARGVTDIQTPDLVKHLRHNTANTEQNIKHIINVVVKDIKERRDMSHPRYRRPASTTGFSPRLKELIMKKRDEMNGGPRLTDGTGGTVDEVGELKALLAEKGEKSCERFLDGTAGMGRAATEVDDTLGV